MDAESGSSSEDVARLASALVERERQVAVLSTLTRTWARILGGPLGEFYSSPEFWRRNYPVRQGPDPGCQRTCARMYNDALLGCQELSSEDQPDCIRRAHEELSNCIDKCLE
jgi:hypothetical protein